MHDNKRSMGGDAKDAAAAHALADANADEDASANGMRSHSGGNAPNHQTPDTNLHTPNPRWRLRGGLPPPRSRLTHEHCWDAEASSLGVVDGNAGVSTRAPTCLQRFDRRGQAQ